MNGVSTMVIFRSRSLDRVRVDIIAGTLHPNPISIGTKERPDSPIFRSSLSITKATRAIYPLSSSRDKKKNNSTIIGRKDNTLPTPAKTPSIINDCSHSLPPTFCSSFAVASVTKEIPLSSNCCSGAPSTEKVNQKIVTMIPKKIGMPKYL